MVAAVLPVAGGLGRGCRRRASNLSGGARGGVSQCPSDGRRAREPEKQDVVVFSGNLEYHPNIMAVRFFRREIWPLLRARWPELVWRLVGKNAHAVRALHRGRSADSGDRTGGGCHRGTRPGESGRGSAAGGKRYAAENPGGLGGRLRGGFDQPGRRRAGCARWPTSIAGGRCRRLCERRIETSGIRRIKACRWPPRDENFTNDAIPGRPPGPGWICNACNLG